MLTVDKKMRNRNLIHPLVSFTLQKFRSPWVSHSPG